MGQFFSGDVIMDWIGERGFGATMTCRRDCLSFGVPGQYFHKQKKCVVCQDKGGSFFCNLLLQLRIMMAGGGYKPYQRVYCRFQSTSYCNISTVNALSECKLYVEPR